MCLLDGHGVMETFFGLHVVSCQHVEASPLKLVGGLTRLPHHQLQEKDPKLSGYFFFFYNFTTQCAQRL